MSESVWTRRAQTGLAWMFGGIALVVLGVLGLWVYMAANAKPLHPDPQGVPSVTRAAPGPQWTGSVAQGRQIARAALVDQNLPGLSVAVGVRSEIVWAEGFGWADLENKVKVAPDTRFRIGTASVALTSAAVGLLLEKAQVHLDDEIQAYVPAFPRKQWPVTLRQLMAHVAGVKNDGGDEGPLLSQRCERPIDGLRFFQDSPLLFEPGTRYRYSSYGWILVSAAVEAAAGDELFFTFMRRKIFGPLGMDHTTADSTAESIPDRTTSYFPKFAAENRYGPDVMRPVDYSCYSGASALVSTPTDLVRFGIAIDDGKLLQPATVEVLQAPQQLANGDQTGHALGWDLDTPTLAGRQTRMVAQEGTLLGGPTASFMTFPEYGIVVSVISNTSYADTRSVALKIAETFAERAGSRH